MAGPASVLFLSNGDPTDRFHASGAPAQLLGWLKSSFPTVVAVDVSLHGLARFLNIALSWSPNRERWKARLDLNLRSFRRRSKLAQAFVDERGLVVDAIFQMGCLWAPPRVGTAPLYLLLDFTNAIAQAEFPNWAPFRSKMAARRWLEAEGEVYRRASRIFTASARVRQSLLHDYGIAAENVSVVGLGGHVEGSKDGEKQFDGRTILFVGRDFERKGGPLLLQAFRGVRATIPNARLVIVGPTARGSEPGVDWIGPVSNRRQLSELFAAAHVFVMPSWCEPFGHVFVEAMNHRLPCVGTNTGGIPDIVGHGVTGYLVERGDVEGLTAAVVGLLSSPDSSRALGKAGFVRAAADFSWPVVCERMREGIISTGSTR